MESLPIEFRFRIYTKNHTAETILKHYSLDHLSEWLNHQSELSHFFYFGDRVPDAIGSQSDTEPRTDSTKQSSDKYPEPIQHTIEILTDTELLTLSEKRYIFNLYILNVFVNQVDEYAVCTIQVQSDYEGQSLTPAILQFLFNHIYNQWHFGLYRFGILPPPTEKQKQTYHRDEIGWSMNFLRTSRSKLDTLFFTEYELGSHHDIFQRIQSPIYLSNYNLECYPIRKGIEKVTMNIQRHQKSIQYIRQKCKGLIEHRSQQYDLYRETYFHSIFKKYQPITLSKNETTSFTTASQSGVEKP